MKYLFTFEEYSHLNIEKTTNRSVEFQSDKYYVTFSSFDRRFGIDTDLRRNNDAII